MVCPKCVGKLQKTVVTIRKVHDVKELQGAGVSFDLELDQCYVCGGVWFDRGELDKYKAEKITVINSTKLGKGLDQELDIKKGKCPRCEIEMKRQPYEKVPEIIIDVCEKCHGVWLDSTEIDKVERAQKGMKGFLDLFFKGFKRKQRSNSER